MLGTTDAEVTTRTDEEPERRYPRLPFILIVVDELNDL